MRVLDASTDSVRPVPAKERTEDHSLAGVFAVLDIVSDDDDDAEEGRIVGGINTYQLLRFLQADIELSFEFDY